jgi:hypothetical protein
MNGAQNGANGTAATAKVEELERHIRVIESAFDEDDLRRVLEEYVAHIDTGSIRSSRCSKKSLAC